MKIYFAGSPGGTGKSSEVRNRLWYQRGIRNRLVSFFFPPDFHLWIEEVRRQEAREERRKRWRQNESDCE